MPLALFAFDRTKNAITSGATNNADRGLNFDSTARLPALRACNANALACTEVAAFADKKDPIVKSRNSVDASNNVTGILRFRRWNRIPR